MIVKELIIVKLVYIFVVGVTQGSDYHSGAKGRKEEKSLTDKILIKYKENSITFKYDFRIGKLYKSIKNLAEDVQEKNTRETGEFKQVNNKDKLVEELLFDSDLPSFKIGCKNNGNEFSKAHLEYSIKKDKLLKTSSTFEYRDTKGGFDKYKPDKCSGIDNMKFVKRFQNIKRILYLKRLHDCDSEVNELGFENFNKEVFESNQLEDVADLEEKNIYMEEDRDSNRFKNSEKLSDVSQVDTTKIIKNFIEIIGRRRIEEDSTASRDTWNKFLGFTTRKRYPRDVGIKILNSTEAYPGQFLSVKTLPQDEKSYVKSFTNFERIATVNPPKFPNGIITIKRYPREVGIKILNLTESYTEQSIYARTLPQDEKSFVKSFPNFERLSTVNPPIEFLATDHPRQSGYNDKINSKLSFKNYLDTTTVGNFNTPIVDTSPDYANEDISLKITSSYNEIPPSQTSRNGIIQSLKDTTHLKDEIAETDTNYSTQQYPEGTTFQDRTLEVQTLPDNLIHPSFESYELTTVGYTHFETTVSNKINSFTNNSFDIINFTLSDLQDANNNGTEYDFNITHMLSTGKQVNFYNYTHDLEQPTKSNKLVNSSLNAFEDINKSIEYINGQNIDPIPWRMTFYIVCLLVSIPFLAATLLVYALLPQLNQSDHGKATMCYLISVLFGYTSLTVTLVYGQSLGIMCYIFGYLLHFCILSITSWLNVMCFDILWAFSVLERKNEFGSSKFTVYSIYAWGLPAGIVATTLALSGHPYESDYLPDLGGDLCFYQQERTRWLYCHGPMSILMIVNVIMFVCTGVIIHHHKQKTKILNSTDSARSRVQRRWFRVYCKLFFVTGMNWVAELLSLILDADNSTVFFIVTDTANVLIGIIIFVILVCHRRVLSSLRRWWKGQDSLTTGRPPALTSTLTKLRRSIVNLKLSQKQVAPSETAFN